MECRKSAQKSRKCLQIKLSISLTDELGLAPKRSRVGRRTWRRFISRARAGDWLDADENSRWVYNLDNELTARVRTAAATDLTITVLGEVEPGGEQRQVV
jgi:hypothetical protein